MGTKGIYGNKKWGQELRALREGAGLSQVQVGEKMGLTNGVASTDISGWERGMNGITWDKYQKMLAAFPEVGKFSAKPPLNKFSGAPVEEQSTQKKKAGKKQPVRHKPVKKEVNGDTVISDIAGFLRDPGTNMRLKLFLRASLVGHVKKNKVKMETLIDELFQLG